MIKRERWVEACQSSELPERKHLTMDIQFAGEMISALLIRFQGAVYAYRNQCVHMVRRLDSEGDHIFDSSGELLRCTMHGIVYQPETGESLSNICHGQKLLSIKVTEDGGKIYFADKRVKRAE